MPTMDERLAGLEGRVREQSQMFSVLREMLTGFERRLEARFDANDRRFETVDRRFESIEDKLSRNLIWTVGIQVTVLVVVIGAVVAALTR